MLKGTFLPKYDPLNNWNVMFIEMRIFDSKLISFKGSHHNVVFIRNNMKYCDIHRLRTEYENNTSIWTSSRSFLFLILYDWIYFKPSR